jgi:hypothetical protein
MSVRALTWSFNLLLHDLAAKAVLNALADHADEEGMCWPSMTRIARFAGCEEKTVRRALARLVERGLIEREARPGKSDVFRLNFDAPGEDDPSPNAPLPKRAPLPKTAPPNEGGTPDFEAQTPPNEAHDPSQRGRGTVSNRQKNPHEPSKGTTNEPPRTKLPRDWRPTLDDRGYAIGQGLDADAVEAAFTDYFGEGRGRSEKRTLDGWSKRFRVWVSADAARRPSAPGRAQNVRPARGNDAFYQQLADIAREDPGDEGTSGQ